jgi:hypothetical protein
VTVTVTVTEHKFGDEEWGCLCPTTCALRNGGWRGDAWKWRRVITHCTEYGVLHAMLDVSEWWRRKGAGSSLQERPELLGLWLIVVLVPASLPPHHNDLHESRIKILRADAGIELFKASPPKHPSLLSPLLSRTLPSLPIIPISPPVQLFRFPSHDPRSPPPSSPILRGCNLPHQRSSRAAYQRRTSSKSVEPEPQSSVNLHPMATCPPAWRQHGDAEATF